MTTHDTWILVSVPGRPSGRRIATRIGLALLAWSAQRQEHRARSVELDRVERPLPAPRPFC